MKLDPIQLATPATQELKRIEKNKQGPPGTAPNSRSAPKMESLRSTYRNLYRKHIVFDKKF